MNDSMGCVERTSDVLVFLRAHARDMEAIILQTHNRLRVSSESASRTQTRLNVMQQKLDSAMTFLDNTHRQ